MNWRTIALVLYLVGTLNMAAGMYIWGGDFSFRSVALAFMWPAYPVMAIVAGISP